MHPLLRIQRSQIKNTRKKKRKKNVKKVTRIQRYAEKLNSHLPRSEQWFQSLWNIHKFNDKYNYPLGGYIPDVISCQYRYIIEIDGSAHDTEMQKYKDRKKDAFYKKKRYQVFRIAYNPNDEASNILQYEAVLQAVLKIRASQ